MTRPSRFPRSLVVAAVVFAAVLTAGCQHIHDPWVKPGTMQTQRDVGLHQQAQLEKRQLYGQSDR